MQKVSELTSAAIGNTLINKQTWGNVILNVNSFGAKGNGLQDDTLMIQNALNSIDRPTSVQFSSGMYRVSGPIYLPPFVVEIIGVGVYPTFISNFSTSIIESVFETDDNTVYEGLSFRNIGILGGGTANYAIRAKQMNHTLFHRVNVQATRMSALKVQGYSNVFDNCEIYSNQGSGISCYDGPVNNININNCKIYANGGIGVFVGGGTDGGLNINITGCGIEQNAVAGIVAYNVKSLNINKNYFERNAALGYGYTIPEAITIKSDIHILAYDGAQIGNSVSRSCDCVEIIGNHVTPYATYTELVNTDSFVFIGGLANKVSIQHNQVFDTTKINELVSIYRNNKYSGVIGELNVSTNSTNKIEFVGTVDANTEMFRHAHLIKTNELLTPKNYANQNLLEWSVIDGTTGTFQKIAGVYQNYPVFGIGTGDRLWGVILDLTITPELKGKYVWFGCWYNTQGGLSNLRLIMDGQSEINTTTYDNNSVWQFKSICRRIDDSATSVFYAVQKTGSGSQDVLVSHPVFAIMGDSASKFPTPDKVEWKRAFYPVDGHWSVGERVVNITPTVGQPKAWINTVAGSPGTWVSEGNL
ncbi:Pectate lyase superfamily protein [compost metagenome]